MASVPQPLKGFNDRFAEEVKLREFVINTFKRNFEMFGYEPLETPALELAENMTGVSGEEFEKMFYRFKDQGGRDVMMKAEVMMGMCRAVASNYNTITFPYKRYQIQQVWRAENVQKGRLREFTQCDADTVGSSSMVCDGEYIQMGLGILGELGFKEYRARISNRKFLNGVARLLNIPEDALYGMCMSLDKLEKIGREKVKKELVDVRGFEEGRAEDLLSLTAPDVFRAKNAVERVDELLKTVGKTEVGREGLEELRMIFDYLSSAGVDQSQYVFDPSLARGLAHYTGPIWEFEIIDGNIGSVGGCGRYDNIIGDYLGKGEQVPATGGSFGIERIVLVLKEQGLVDIDTAPSQVLVTLFGPDMLASSLEAATSLREAGIPALLYPDADSIGRQFKYADRKGIPWVVVIGPEEKEAGVVQLKNLQSGTQERMTIEDAVKRVSAEE